MRCNSKSVLVRLGSQLAACRCIASNVGHAGLVELREYTLQPSGIREFIQLTTEKAPLRVRLLPLLGYVGVYVRHSCFKATLFLDALGLK